jgi:hypothetical protein
MVCFIELLEIPSNLLVIDCESAERYVEKYHLRSPVWRYWRSFQLQSSILFRIPRTLSQLQKDTSVVQFFEEASNNVYYYRERKAAGAFFSAEDQESERYTAYTRYALAMNELVAVLGKDIFDIGESVRA